MLWSYICASWSEKRYALCKYSSSFPFSKSTQWSHHIFLIVVLEIGGHNYLCRLFLSLPGRQWISHSAPSSRKVQKTCFCSLFADFIPHRTVFQQTAWFHRHQSHHSLLLPLSLHIRYVRFVLVYYVSQLIMFWMWMKAEWIPQKTTWALVLLNHALNKRLSRSIQVSFGAGFWVFPA